MTRKLFRRNLRIRRWLVLAVGVASLALASSAPAMQLDQGGGGAGRGLASQPASPVQRIVAQELGRRNDVRLFGPASTARPIEVVPQGGFDWGDAGIGAGVALAAALGGAGIVLLARNRTRGRLATQL